MKNYDCYAEGGTHVIRITLQNGEYLGHITQRIGGNCHGLNMLDFNFVDTGDFSGCDCLNDCQMSYDEEYDVFSAVLKDEKGDTLSVEGDYSKFNDMIVALEIIEYEPE